MKNKISWIIAVCIVGAVSFGTGSVTGYSVKVKQSVVVQTKEVEVIKEVLPPSVCLDTFTTKIQYLDDTPHCNHPAQMIHVESFSRGNPPRLEVQITCKCPH